MDRRFSKRFSRFFRYLLFLTVALTVLSVSLLTIFSSGAPAAVSQDSPSVIVLGTGKYRVLRVPYLSQGTTSWCFQTSLAMVLRFQGKDVSVEDIANATRHRPNQAMNFLTFVFGWVRTYVARYPDISLKQTMVRPWTFAEYCSSIDSDAPVIVSCFGFPGHTVVVVGYMQDDSGSYLYVHDPSGFLTQGKWKSDRTAFARVSWQQFSDTFGGVLVQDIAISSTKK